MSEHGALLRAVCEYPDEDTPRLVFADWLQENGEEARAAFIRLQIALAAVPEAEREPEEVAREKALLAAHRDEWVEPLEAFAGARGDHYEFRRGFVEGIASDGEVLVEEGERLFELAPIRALYLSDEEEYGALAKCGWLLRLRELDLKGSGLSRNFDPAPLIGSPYLANLTALGLGGEDDNGHLDIDGVRALIASPHLGKLEALDLSGNWLSGEAFALFLTATNLSSLRDLNLRFVQIGTPGLLSLLAAPLAEQLRSLDLTNNGIGENGARALLASPRLAKLERLVLQGRYDAPRGEVSAMLDETRRALRARFGDRVGF